MFVLGAVTGSFLSVVVHRLPRPGESIVRPRSHCPRCGRVVRWYDNVPLLSFVWLRGRCRDCGTRIGLRYVILEMLTPVLWLGFYEVRSARIGEAALADPVFWVGAAFLAVLLAASAIDLRYRIIPDELTLGLLALGPVMAVLVPELHRGCAVAAFDANRAGIPGPGGALLSSGAGLVVGAALPYGMGVFGRLAFRREAMGLGDVKLLAGVGALLGAGAPAASLILGSLLGAVVGIAARVRGGGRTLPFCPFLAVGAALWLAFRPEMWDWFLGRFPMGH